MNRNFVWEKLGSYIGTVKVQDNTFVLMEMELRAVTMLGEGRYRQMPGHMSFTMPARNGCFESYW